MILNNHLLHPEPCSGRITCTAAHPQLRDLLVYTPETEDVSVVCWDSIARHALDGKRAPSYTRLRFSPSTITTGMGFIAVAGQASELALKSASSDSTWCHQLTDHSGGSINNSLFIAPSPTSLSTPRLYVSNNDETIKCYDVASSSGGLPDYERARRSRAMRRRRLRDSAAEDSSEMAIDEVEEDGVHDQGGPCTLERVDSATIPFDTAVNACAVSPDGRRLVAVGDTNEVHLYDCGSTYSHVHTFPASNDACFSVDWSATGQKFAVASQDGFVHVYDCRNLPPSGHSSQPPKTLATIKATQSGPAGAIRKLKFSPGSRVDSELLAFTEHRSKVQVVDARTFNERQVLDVTSASSTSSTSPPSRTWPSSVRSPRAFVDSLYAERGSPEERFVRRLLQDVGSTTEERSRSRGERGWSYIASELQGGEEESDGEEEDEIEDDEEELSRQVEADRLPTRRGNDEDCPPEGSPPSSLGASTRSEVLSDLRTRRDTRTFYPRAERTGSLNSNTISNDLPPFHLSSAANHPIGARILSGYSPLAAYGIPESREWRTERLGPAYQATSLYFPVESTPSDLLGLDWDEEGTSLLVATEDKLTEWGVDTRARRNFGEWEMR